VQKDASGVQDALWTATQFLLEEGREPVSQRLHRNVDPTIPGYPIVGDLLAKLCQLSTKPLANEVPPI
jgi:hypothetical protein